MGHMETMETMEKSSISRYFIILLFVQSKKKLQNMHKYSIIREDNNLG